MLRAAVDTVLDIFPEPTCIETGCIRNRDEGTDSTLIIASALHGRGRFFTFEIEPSHIEICPSVCQEYDADIQYIQDDSCVNLQRLAHDAEI